MGKVSKVKGKKITAKFKSGHGVEAGDRLKVYARGKGGKPGKMLGTLTVKKVKGKKVIGTFKKKGKVNKKKLRKALVVKKGGGSSASYSGGKKIPMVYLNVLAGYSLMEGGFSTEMSANPTTPDAVKEQLTSNNISKNLSGSALIGGAETSIYPLTFLGKEFYYGLLGMEASYKLLMATWKNENTTKGEETTSQTFAEANPNGNPDKNLSIIKLAVNFRYASFFGSLFSATTLQFFPFYRFIIPPDAEEKNEETSSLIKSADETETTETAKQDSYFKYMTVGLHQRIKVGGFSSALYFYYPILTDMINDKGESFQDEVIKKAEEADGENSADFSLTGLTVGADVGYQMGPFATHFYGEYEFWGFSSTLSSEMANVTMVAGYTFMSFGVKVGVVF